MATDKSKSTKIEFADLAKSTAEKTGIPEKEVKQVVAGLHSTITDIIADKGPKKIGEELTIDARIVSLRFEKVAESTANGKLYPARTVPSVSIPASYTKVANANLDIKAKPIEAKATKAAKAG